MIFKTLTKGKNFSPSFGGRTTPLTVSPVFNPGYGERLLHGEGVAIGCALAFELSQRLGLCSQEAPSRVRAHLRAMGMKVDLADIQGDLPDAEALLALMGQDKKVVDGKLRFILARGIGEAFVASDVPSDVVLGVLRDALRGRG